MLSAKSQNHRSSSGCPDNFKFLSMSGGPNYPHLIPHGPVMVLAPSRSTFTRRVTTMGKRKTVNWSNDEDEFLLQNYKTMIDKDIAMALNRTEAAVKLHRLIMGLNKVESSVKKKDYTIKHKVTPEERAAKANRKAAIGLIELLDDIINGKIIVESSESNCKLGEFHTITIEYRNAPREKYRELVAVSL